jgi:hypothetical protein
MKYSALSIIFLIFAVSGTAQQVFNFEGETLRYNAKYGFIKGGEVIILSKKVKYNDIDCYDVKIDMYSIGLVNDIFHFHDIFRSIFSKQTLKPYKFIRDAHEGSYSQYEEVVYYDNYVESSVNGHFETSDRYYDIVSGIFALRSYNWAKLNTNDVLVFPIYFDEKIVNTKIVYKGKEKIKLNGKYYNCHKFVPIFDGVKMFSKEGVSVYFSDDYKRKPILIKVNFRVGSFKVEYVEK